MDIVDIRFSDTLIPGSTIDSLPDFFYVLLILQNGGGEGGAHL